MPAKSVSAFNFKNDFLRRLYFLGLFVFDANMKLLKVYSTQIESQRWT